MLSLEKNAILTQVAAGTAMGKLMRSYWLPVLLSTELPEKDGRPIRVRLLSESLVAFRDSEGRVGLLEEHCPHRRASLYFGRNEECGLRCVYHGWKFDIQGKCVDLPSEPPESKFREKVQAQAYPCVERNGIIWTYMGKEPAPGFPEFEWAKVPSEQRYVTKRLLFCNWAQALEGDIDSSHASFLHSSLDPVDYAKFDSAKELHYFHNDRHPRYEVAEADFGLIMAARRNAEPTTYYWRAAQYVMPIFVMIAPFGDELLHANIWLPMDEEKTMVWSIDWHPERSLTAKEREIRNTGMYFHATRFLPATGEAGSSWATPEALENDYFLDYELQKNKMYSGIQPLWCQDKAVQESMGPIVDREDEHLAQSDLAIIRWRNRVLAAAEACKTGAILPGMKPETHRIRPVGVVLPRSAAWQSELLDKMAIRPRSVAAE